VGGKDYRELNAEKKRTSGRATKKNLWKGGRKPNGSNNLSAMTSHISDSRRNDIERRYKTGQACREDVAMRPGPMARNKKISFEVCKCEGKKNRFGKKGGTSLRTGWNRRKGERRTRISPIRMVGTKRHLYYE